MQLDSDSEKLVKDAILSAAKPIHRGFRSGRHDLIGWACEFLDPHTLAKWFGGVRGIAFEVLRLESKLNNLKDIRFGEFHAFLISNLLQKYWFSHYAGPKDWDELEINRRIFPEHFPENDPSSERLFLFNYKIEKDDLGWSMHYEVKPVRKPGARDLVLKKKNAKRVRPSPTLELSRINSL